MMPISALDASNNVSSGNFDLTSIEHSAVPIACRPAASASSSVVTFTQIQAVSSLATALLARSSAVDAATSKVAEAMAFSVQPASASSSGSALASSSSSASAASPPVFVPPIMQPSPPLYGGSIELFMLQPAGNDQSTAKPKVRKRKIESLEESTAKLAGKDDQELESPKTKQKIKQQTGREKKLVHSHLTMWNKDARHGRVIYVLKNGKSEIENLKEAVNDFFVKFQEIINFPERVRKNVRESIVETDNYVVENNQLSSTQKRTLYEVLDSASWEIDISAGSPRRSLVLLTYIYRRQQKYLETLYQAKKPSVSTHGYNSPWTPEQTHIRSQLFGVIAFHSVSMRLYSVVTTFQNTSFDSCEPQNLTCKFHCNSKSKLHSKWKEFLELQSAQKEPSEPGIWMYYPRKDEKPELFFISAVGTSIISALKAPPSEAAGSVASARSGFASSGSVAVSVGSRPAASASSASSSPNDQSASASSSSSASASSSSSASSSASASAASTSSAASPGAGSVFSLANELLSVHTQTHLNLRPKFKQKQIQLLSEVGTTFTELISDINKVFNTLLNEVGMLGQGDQAELLSKRSALSLEVQHKEVIHSASSLEKRYNEVSYSASLGSAGAPLSIGQSLPFPGPEEIGKFAQKATPLNPLPKKSTGRAGKPRKQTPHEELTLWLVPAPNKPAPNPHTRKMYTLNSTNKLSSTSKLSFLARDLFTDLRKQVKTHVKGVEKSIGYFITSADDFVKKHNALAPNQQRTLEEVLHSAPWELDVDGEGSHISKRSYIILTKAYQRQQKYLETLYKSGNESVSIHTYSSPWTPEETSLLTELFTIVAVEVKNIGMRTFATTFSDPSFKEAACNRPENLVNCIETQAKDEVKKKLISVWQEFLKLRKMTQEPGVWMYYPKQASIEVKPEFFFVSTVGAITLGSEISARAALTISSAASASSSSSAAASAGEQPASSSSGSSSAAASSSASSAGSSGK